MYHTELHVPVSLRGRLIHVADPDLRSCEVLSTLFRIEGFDTSFSVDPPGMFAALAHRRADVVVMSRDFGVDWQAGSLDKIKADLLGTPVIVTIAANDAELTVAAMKSGADDVVAKPVDGERLLRIVKGFVTVSTDIGSVASTGALSALTSREREVLNLIARGETNGTAGGILGISRRTVEVHRARIISKLGANNTADLIRIALTRQN
jgi:FixJ family two-component response regulator